MEAVGRAWSAARGRRPRTDPTFRHLPYRWEDERWAADDCRDPTGGLPPLVFAALLSTAGGCRMFDTEAQAYHSLGLAVLSVATQLDLCPPNKGRPC
jgi:hypothetical protein